MKEEKELRKNTKDNNITNKITAIHVSITKVRMIMELFKNLKNILIFWELIKMGKLLIGLYTKHFLKKMKVVHPDKNIGKDTTAQAQEIKAMEDFLKEQLEYYLMQKEKK